MKQTIFYCDRCGEKIDDFVYTITVYCEVVPGETIVSYKGFMEKQDHNEKQNAAIAGGTARHLCRKCKDEITDGIFIV